VLPEGNTVWLGLSSVLASLGRLASDLHGWPALSLTFVLLLFTVKPRRKRDLWLAFTALSLIGGYGLYWTSGDVFGPRYVYESVTALVILSAAGIVRVGRHVSAAAHRKQRRRAAYRYALLGLVLVDLFLYLPWQLGRYRGLYGVTAAPRETLQAADLHNALVIVRDENGWKDYAVPFSMNRPTLDGDVVYANDCGPLVDELLARYAGRSVYLYDGQSDQGQRLIPYDVNGGG
jgi:hypothetical protein